MAQILSDREIFKLIENGIISGGDARQVRSNSYVFRLGQEVRFFSTRERKEGEIGDILIINAGDSALVHSVESLDFSQGTVDRLYKGQQLCALLTPSTTLIREALQLPSTKVDPGYSGTLNWTIRNSGIEPIQLEIGEPVFKATFFLLIEDEEIPEKKYGDRTERDYYHGKTGLVDSRRRLPVDIGARKKICVSSKGTELERLKQSGFPYDFIATQLQQVGDHLEIVTKDFARLDERFEKQGRELGEKIDRIESDVIKTLDDRIDKFSSTVDDVFFRKVVNGGVGLISTLLALSAGVGYMIDKGKADLLAPIAGILSLVGFIFLVILWALVRRRPSA